LSIAANCAPLLAGFPINIDPAAFAFADKMLGVPFHLTPIGLVLAEGATDYLWNDFHTVLSGRCAKRDIKESLLSSVRNLLEAVTETR